MLIAASHGGAQVARHSPSHAGAQVARHADGAKRGAGVPRNAVHFGFSDAQRRDLLRHAPRLDAVATELRRAPARATSGLITPGVFCVHNGSYDALRSLTLAP